MSNRTAYFYDPDVGNFHYGKILATQSQTQAYNISQPANLAIFLDEQGYGNTVISFLICDLIVTLLYSYLFQQSGPQVSPQTRNVFAN